jgi:hypothetical protein
MGYGDKEFFLENGRIAVDMGPGWVTILPNLGLFSVPAPPTNRKNGLAGFYFLPIRPRLSEGDEHREGSVAPYLYRLRTIRE